MLLPNRADSYRKAEFLAGKVAMSWSMFCGVRAPTENSCKTKKTSPLPLANTMTIGYGRQPMGVGTELNSQCWNGSLLVWVDSANSQMN